MEPQEGSHRRDLERERERESDGLGQVRTVHEVGKGEEECLDEWRGEGFAAKATTMDTT